MASINQHISTQMQLHKSMHKTDTGSVAEKKKKRNKTTNNHLEFWALTLLHRNDQKPQQNQTSSYHNIYPSLSKPRKATTSTQIMNYNNLSLEILTMS